MYRTNTEKDDTPIMKLVANAKCDFWGRSDRVEIPSGDGLLPLESLQMDNLAIKAPEDTVKNIRRRRRDGDVAFTESPVSVESQVDEALGSGREAVAKILFLARSNPARVVEALKALALRSGSIQGKDSTELEKTRNLYFSLAAIGDESGHNFLVDTVMHGDADTAVFAQMALMFANSPSAQTAEKYAEILTAPSATTPNSTLFYQNKQTQNLVLGSLLSHQDASTAERIMKRTFDQYKRDDSLFHALGNMGPNSYLAIPYLVAIMNDTNIPLAARADALMSLEGSLPTSKESAQFVSYLSKTHPELKDRLRSMASKALVSPSLTTENKEILKGLAQPTLNKFQHPISHLERRSKRGFWAPWTTKEWDSSETDLYDLVANSASRKEDVMKYPFNTAFLIAKRVGFDSLNVQAGSGSFLGVKKDGNIRIKFK
jgi:hypothetical protein